MNKSEETVTIPKSEYDRLISSEVKLDCLHNHGVDNWDWYGEAMEDFAKWEKGDGDE